ncbi:CMP-N-acetylneuraminate-poly-alpha-2,8-sialyltransferase-like [Lytechinus pictus]|uniref:CMP-N-acetylneuraminate-poly-alpha-2, 8-sialyltransferase-like n=1 Tax=Lytechinus pictus TaxID=7653 RepID=UPI0030BA2898
MSALRTLRAPNRGTVLSSLAIVGFSLAMISLTLSSHSSRVLSGITSPKESIRRLFAQETEESKSNSTCNCSCESDVPDYDYDYQNTSREISRHSSGSHLLKGAASDTERSIVNSLWNFKDINDEVLFLYEQLAIRNSHVNHTNTNIFRDELAKYRANLNGSSAILLHQGNCQVNRSSKKLIKTSAEFFNLLPKGDPFGLPEQKRYPKCAIIGNSGSLLHSGCGKSIDEHDFVIRCNLASLAPFKEDAGLKSDYITMNPTLYLRRYKGLGKKENIDKYNQDMSQYGGMLSIPCFGMKEKHNARAIRSYEGKKPKIVCMNGLHFRTVTDFWKKTGVIDKKPSTGFYLVTMAVQLCDEIDLYGFWPFSSRLGSNKTEVPYHYFDEMTSVKAESSHRMNKEFTTLLQLHLQGILRVHLGSCS